MKFLLIAVALLLGAVALALGMVREQGYVLIGFGDWSMETTLVFFGLAVFLSFGALYYGLRFLARMLGMPQQLREWQQKRRALKARNALNRGLIEMAEGQWASAEKRLIKQARYSENPLLNYLVAARAAQQQGAHDRRDQYLAQAHQKIPEADIAVGLTQAELQLAHRQTEQALATLTHLRTLAPRHAQVAHLLMRLYQHLGEWQHVLDLLPQLRRRDVIDALEANQIESQAHIELMARAAEHRNLDSLRGVWNKIPRNLAQQEDPTAAYAGHLHTLGANDEAESIVRGALKREWSQRLAQLYGVIQGPDMAKQLAAAEKWLQEHPKDPVLLQALGRLAVRNRLWGKARSYLETSIGITPTVESYRMLGQLLEQTGDKGKAADCFRKGIVLASVDGRGALPSPAERSATAIVPARRPGAV